MLREFFLRHIYPKGIFRTRYFEISRPHTESALVSMCLWNRPEHFRNLLHYFASQDYQHGLVLGLWNNDRSLARFYERELQRFISDENCGAIKKVQLVHSALNTGGVGRFYMGRKLVHQYKHPYIVFVDDDQVIQKDWLSGLMNQAEPNTQKSWWAWHILKNEYWDRTRAQPGEEVDYAATGGMIADASVLKSKMLFRDLPRESWFLEDIWLNHVGLIEGQRLFALDTEMEMVLDETNQFRRLAHLKPDFYRLLKKTRDEIAQSPNIKD